MRVVALHLASEHRAENEPVDAVVVEAGRGIEGDRWFGTRHRHVSVQALDDLDAAAADLGAPVAPSGTRRNITLDHGPVPTEPGERLWIGDVELEVVRIAAPCRIMETSVGPGARNALRRRGGSVFRALGSGTVRVGDEAAATPRTAAAR